MNKTIEENTEIMIAEAEALKIAERKEILQSFRETELHKQLLRLFESMEPNLEVVLTHGRDEYGKDLVIIRRGAFDTMMWAVIVKCGSITGKAGGIIDVIKSQINMAIQHPYTANPLEPLTPSKIIFIATGNISSNAQERIKAEFNNFPIAFFDVSKLVSLFTKYYPRVFFGGYEYDYLTGFIEKLENSHLFSKRRFALSQIFIEPALRRIGSDQKSWSPDGEKNVNFKRLQSAIASKRKVAIIGEAGCGKSSILKKLAIDEMRARREKLPIEKNSKIPVFYEAKSITNLASTEEMIDEIRRQTGAPEPLSIGTLYVDGLDEMRTENRSPLLKLLMHAAQSANITVVISSRCEDYFEASDWTTYEVIPFRTDQAISLCEKTIEDIQVVSSLKKGIAQVRNNFELTPLAIFLLLSIIEERQEVPASLTELYSQYVDNVLGKHDKDKGIQVLFEYELKKRFLAELSKKLIIDSTKDEMSLSEFQSFGKQYFLNYDWPWSNWEVLLDELKRSSLIEIDFNHDMLKFKHRTFLEYFAAYELFTNPDEIEPSTKIAVDYYFDPYRSDIAFYYFGLKKSITISIINQILNYENAVDPLFALICKMRSGRLIQACWHSKVAVKQFGVLKASRFAAAVREEFKKSIPEKDTGRFEIMGDIILSSISIDSFGSVFLLPQIETILQGDIPRDPDELIGHMCLLVGTSQIMDPSTKESLVEKYLDHITAENDKVLEGRCLFYLTLASNNDAVQKSVRRHFKSFVKKNRPIVQSLFLND